MAAVSTQLMPRETACRMAATDSGVVLASPAVGPASAPDGPGSETDLGDAKIGGSQRAFQQFLHGTVSFAKTLTIADMRVGVLAATAARADGQEVAAPRLVHRDPRVEILEQVPHGEHRRFMPF